MLNLGFKDINLLEDPIKSDEAVQIIIRNMRMAKESLKIYAGEAHWAIFDHPDMVRALRDLGEKGVVIQVVAGPVISRGGAPESPEILNLAKEGTVDLYFRPQRGSYPHFSIIDDRVAFAEKENHKPLLQLHLRKAVRILKDRSPVEFDNYMIKFNSKAKKSNIVKGSKNQYVVLRSSEIRAVSEIAEQRGKNYDDLTGSEIRGLVEEISSVKKKIEGQFEKAVAVSH